MCFAFTVLFAFGVSAKADKNILLNAPVVDYTAGKITINGSLDDYTYSMWDNSRITLYVAKNGVEPADILLDNSALFNIAEFSPNRDGSFSYTFTHVFKETFDRCTVYVNYSGYSTKQVSYSISNADYNEILSGRTLIAVNSPVYYAGGVKCEAESVPYYYGDEVRVPNEMLSKADGEGYTLLSEIDGASLDEESGIISVGGAIPNEKAMAIQSLFGVHVSPDGDDTGHGMNTAPVKTVSRALELCRFGFAQEIFVHNGIYEDVLLIDNTLSDITIKGIGEVTVRAPSVKIPASEFKLVQDDAVLNALPHTARGRVLVADFPGCNTEIPSIMGKGTIKQNESYYKVYQNAAELQNARFPNAGFATADATFGMTDDCSSEIIYYNDTDKLLSWNNANDARVLIFRECGYNMTDTDLIGTNTEDNSVVLDNPTKRANHQVIGNRFIIYNLIEELDTAGEWYIDRENEKIYVFPFENFDGLEIVKKTDSILKIDGADNVRVENINFERTRGTGIEILNADNVNIKECDVKSAGKFGIFANNVTNTVIDGCGVSDISKGGINVNWDAYHDPDLKAQNNIVKNCEVHNIGTENFIAGAVYVGGTGNKVTHNTVYDTPHMAIWFDGNDNTVEYNEIFGALKYCDDAGIIYTNAGPYGYGNVVQYNYIHDCHTLNPEPTELYIIYLDYITNGITVKNNIIDAGEDDVVYHAFGLFGGGRDNVLDSNVFIGNTSFLLSNRYQSGTMHDNLITGAVLPKFINSLTDSQRELWFEKYPGLEEEYNFYKNSENDKIGVPRDCKITNNTFSSAYYGTLSSSNFETNAEYKAFFKKKASGGFVSTENNGTVSGNTYVSSLNTADLPAMSAGGGDISIDGTSPDIIYPQNGAVLESGAHTLVWEKAAGAESYSVQISRKGDTSAAVFEAETTENFADTELAQGKYVMKLTAKNGGEEKSVTAEFECRDVALYTTSGELESVACDTVIYVSVPISNDTVTPELRDANGNLVESTVTGVSLAERRIIKITPKTPLIPEKEYSLVISGDSAALKTNKLCAAEAEFKKENGSILTSVKLNSLLERTDLDVDVYVSGKTGDDALGSVKIIPVTLTPQKSEKLSESVSGNLTPEVYMWKKSSSLFPLTIKMSVNN